jgi:hypothetical protein
LWNQQFQADAINLKYFRGDNAYVWQCRGIKHEDLIELTYLLTAYYVQKIDAKNLLTQLKEDDLFGIYTFTFNNNHFSSVRSLQSLILLYGDQKKFTSYTAGACPYAV